MFKIGFVISSFLICQFLFSQTGWFNLNSGVPDRLTSVFFNNANTGFCVGELSRIIKTTDGGNNWDTVRSGFNNQSFYSVCFINNSTGFISGSYILLKSSDEGLSWHIVPRFSNIYTSKVYFINSLTGFVLGGSRIYKTNNTGLNWDSLSYPSSHHISCINFSNNNTGYFGGGWVTTIVFSVLYRTTNAGTNWLKLPEISCNTFLAVKCFNENLLYALVYDCTNNQYIRKFGVSTNGGNNWSFIQLGNEIFYNEMYFINPNTGYLIGEYGFILKTTNAGSNWYNQTQGQGGPMLNSIQFVNDSVGYAAGNNGKIKKTIDGGGPIGLKILSAEIPEYFSIHQNYPNPFNPKTIIKFDIPYNSFNPEHSGQPLVQIRIFDILGREVEVLVNENLKPGTYEVDWDGSGHSSGIYFYIIKAGGYYSAKKMVLLK